MGESYGLRVKYQVFGKQVDLNGDGSQLWDPHDLRWQIGDFTASNPGFERVTCNPGGDSVPIRCFLQR